MDTNALKIELPDNPELDQKLLQLVRHTSRNLEIVVVNVVKELIVAGADVNTRDAAGNFPLILAAGNGLTHIVTELISVPGILVNECDQVDQNGHTALMEAAFYHHSSTITALLKARNIDVNKADSNGQTALMKAVDLPMDNSAASVTALLADPGILVNQQNVNGHTALMQAIFARNTSAVIALLKAPGLMINLKNQKGGTAISIAFKDGQDEVVKILKSYGAFLPYDLAQQDDLAQQAERGWFKKLKNTFSKNLNFEMPNLDHIINHSAGSCPALSSSTASKPRVTFSYDELKTNRSVYATQKLHEEKRQKPSQRLD